MEALAKLEQRVADTYEKEGEEVTACKAAAITKLVPVLCSRPLRSGQRLICLRMETEEDTFFLLRVLAACERNFEQKHGKAPRGVLVRQLQQTLLQK